MASKATDDIEVAEDVDGPERDGGFEKPYVVVGRAIAEAMDELGGRPAFTDLVLGARKIILDAHRARLEHPPAPPSAPLADRAFLQEALYWGTYADAVYEKSLALCLSRVPVSRDDVLKSDWKVVTLRPVFALVHDAGKKKIVLAIRGTHSVSDAMTDACAAAEPFAGDTAHRGMVRAAQWFIDNILEDITGALARYPDCGLLVTGHSLGAGTAALLTILLKEHVEQSRLFCWAFATPACASPTLSEAHKTMIVSVVNDLDAVPRLSLYAAEMARRALEESGWRDEYKEAYDAEYDRMAKYLNDSPVFSRVVKAIDVTSKVLDKALDAASEAASKHLKAAADSKYGKAATAASAKVSAKASAVAVAASVKIRGGAGDSVEEAKGGGDAAIVDSAPPKVPDPMVPVGRIVHLSVSDDVVFARDAPSSEFMRLAPGKTMLSDHSMDLYLARLRAAADRLG
uniref:Fungal lipase-type domain-containing protein n=1 Tax=Bicosoecida sp. CB-2014 TaxID=1486930 RepID=A0A7S1CEC2_9STRA|mmetsp:Transcript_22087/g.77421  ORF Transcript_22087/g.77421 Transcript_22087/m.77421 type:complete len:458 (+) Transcript_22087:113-1486(+)|eukprot:CAMPEP_0203808638 /NCGR_PEP_ID=MMETSP0115-20131106/1728_1 /ASSEMBLY_ACC=CAM_ASM_000227 /TAXON_ID=33651 /ORGANISM="Bicosoecid sp, Strain ms1" /LENGTH=457 /DNA_ID=CAMNT_0050717331 /DNA_START=108 /DNA_END=1481 /DNA_ORIENTATION=-